MNNLATSWEIAVKGWKRNRNKEITFCSKERIRRHLGHFHPVFITNEQIVLQKSAETVLMPLIDKNGSNKTNQQTKQKKDRNEEN